METLLKLLGTLGLLALGPILFRISSVVRGTSLTAARTWGVAAILVWSTAWLVDVLTGAIGPGSADPVWYAVAILMLCPPIAVLGARRPASRVWTWFVLVPLLLVLGLPLASTWQGGMQPGSFRLEAPAVVGFCLVLTMGAGNYLGTRFTSASLLYAAALVLLVAPLSVSAPARFPDVEYLRMSATLCLSLSVIAAGRKLSHRPIPSAAASADVEAFERLWIEFRDLFGIVWSRRIQDRVNDTARRENWPYRLQMQGLVRTADEPADADDERTAKRIEHAFRWLLRRFVDPAWIDCRLQQTE